MQGYCDLGSGLQYLKFFSYDLKYRIERCSVPFLLDIRLPSDSFLALYILLSKSLLNPDSCRSQRKTFGLKR